MSKPKQLLEAGEVIKHGDNEFEVVHVMVNTDSEDNITAYIYEVISKEDADANRKANEQAQSLEVERQANEEVAAKQNNV